MSRRTHATPPPKRRTLKIRSNDEVKVMAGKDRGKNGRVLRVDPAKERVYVEGLNMVKRHVRPKPTPQGSTYRGPEGQLGGVIEVEGPIHISRACPWACPSRSAPNGAMSSSTASCPSRFHESATFGG
jgi:ribosomal protein L24